MIHPLITYYWEGPGTLHGRLKAVSDAQALRMRPKHATLLYRESNTCDGRPFVVLFERETK